MLFARLGGEQDMAKHVNIQVQTDAQADLQKRIHFHLRFLHLSRDIYSPTQAFSASRLAFVYRQEDFRQHQILLDARNPLSLPLCIAL